MEEFDLYGDLDAFDFKVKYEEAEATVKRLAAQLADASKEIKRLEGDNEVLKEQSQALQKSFQALLSTSRSEIRRKDALLAASRKQFDDMLFRRGIHSLSKQHSNSQVECLSKQNDEIHIDKHCSSCDKNTNKQSHENYSTKCSCVPSGEIGKYGYKTNSKLDDAKSSSNHANEVSHVSKLNENANKFSKHSRNGHVREATDKTSREKTSPRKCLASHEQDRIEGQDKTVRASRSPRRSSFDRDRKRLDKSIIEKRSPRRSSVNRERERTENAIRQRRSPRRSIDNSVNEVSYVRKTYSQDCIEKENANKISKHDNSVGRIRERIEKRSPRKSILSHERETTDRRVREKRSPRRRSVSYERERTIKTMREKRSHRH